MLKIAVYHWLPLADNMMPDVEKSLRLKSHDYKVVDIEANDREQLRYSVYYQSYEVFGKINNRGFAQHIFIIPEMPKKSLAEILNEHTPMLRDFVANFIFHIIPLAVKNKMAVLEEKIVSFQEFEAKPFDPVVDKSALTFLREASFTAITFDEAAVPPASFLIENREQTLSLLVDPNKSPVAFSSDETVVCIYSKQFLPDDLEDKFDNNIYHYCSSVVFMHFVSRVVEILKLVKDHMIPLRRQLSIALAKDTEEHFLWMTHLKRYFTYANIKLPLMGKVINHLTDAKISRQFVGSIHNLRNIPYIENSNNLNLGAFAIITKLNEDIGKIDIDNSARVDQGRLGLLYDEDAKEVSILSKELAEVLQGSLMSENVQISSRDLDVQRVGLELDRGGKNRANALKFLSIILSATLGATFYDIFYKQRDI